MEVTCTNVPLQNPKLLFHLTARYPCYLTKESHTGNDVRTRMRGPNITRHITKISKTNRLIKATLVYLLPYLAAYLLIS